MLKDLINEITSASEKAAIASQNWIGKLNEHEADRAAVNAMRRQLNQSNIDGTIVIGEGERDEAPMLFIGENLGTKIGPKIDIAVDPLEGTTICANGLGNSLSVIAASLPGNLLNAPDVYMDKIAIGANLPDDLVDLDNSPLQNLKNIALAKKCDISDLNIVILKRDRHQELIAKVKESGARIKLIGDGDISAVISCCYGSNTIDAYMGIGGAPEGVLAAAALLTLGGQIMGRLIIKSDLEKAHASKMGITDFNKKYLLQDMAKGEVIFSLTGVTDGDFVRGVKIDKDKMITQSLVIYSGDGSVNKIDRVFSAKEY